MNQFFKFVSVLLIAATAPAHAAQIGDSCAPGSYFHAVTSSDVLGCRDGRYAVTSHVGSTPITLAIQVKQEGSKAPLNSATVTTLDGLPVPYQIARDISYVGEARENEGKLTLVPQTVTEGWNLTMVPELTTEGKILVTYMVSKATLIAMPTMKVGDAEIQLPQVDTQKASGTLAFESGKPMEIKIPFGRVAHAGEYDPHQYTMTITATKG